MPDGPGGKKTHPHTHTHTQKASSTKVSMFFGVYSVGQAVGTDATWTLGHLQWRSATFTLRSVTGEQSSRLCDGWNGETDRQCHTHGQHGHIIYSIVCVCVCTYVSIYVRRYVRTYVLRMYVRMHVYMYVCMYVCMYGVTAKRYGLDGPEIESWCGARISVPSTPTIGPTQTPVQCVPGFSWGLSHRSVVLTTAFWRQGCEWVDLYFYLPAGPAQAYHGVAFTLTLRSEVPQKPVRRNRLMLRLVW